MSEPGTGTHTLVVIPCAADKHDGSHPAADLYASVNFARTLRCALAHAADAVDSFGAPVTAKVMILSARYGLIDLDDTIDTYDTKMGDAGCITAAGVAAQLADIAPAAIAALLPAAYRRTLAAAVEANNEDEGNAWIALLDAYEAAPGIGYQRGVAGALERLAA